MKIQNLLLIAIIISLTACGGDSENSVQTNITEETDPMSIFEDGIFYSSSEVKHEVYSSSTENTVPIVNISSSSARNNITYGTLMDERDGQVYKTVVIGNQTWMAENLNYADSVNALGIKGRSWCYDNDPGHCEKYGRLYNWAAAMDSAGNFSSNAKNCGFFSKCFITEPIRGICPEGWHLPSRNELETLIKFAVGFNIAGKNYGGRVLKSQMGWLEGNGTDGFGFAALPAGDRDGTNEAYNNKITTKVIFSGEGCYAAFWSSSEEKEQSAYIMSLHHFHDSVETPYGALKYKALSVRCIRDKDYLVKSSSSSVVKSSSSSISITVSSSSNFYENAESFIDERDGKIYKTVAIGNQNWMAENLNYETESSSCYDEESSNCEKYGRLYTWSAALNACPAGWRLPSVIDWNTLILNVGGSSKAAQNLKSRDEWVKNAEGVDAFGFSALPAGYSYRNLYKNMILGYDEKESSAYFWSSTEFDKDSAFFMFLNARNVAKVTSYIKENGRSVRCLKNDEAYLKQSSSSLVESSTSSKRESSGSRSNSSEKMISCYDIPNIDLSGVSSDILGDGDVEEISCLEIPASDAENEAAMKTICESLKGKIGTGCPKK